MIVRCKILRRSSVELGKTTSAHRMIDSFNTGKCGAGKYVQNHPGEEITGYLTELEETTPPQFT